MTSDCRDLLEQIVGLVEGDLDEFAVARLCAHAADCADCAREIALEQSLVDALRALPPTPEFSVSCPDPEATTVMAIESARRAPETPVVRARARLIGLVSAAAVAAGLLVVVGAQIAGEVGTASPHGAAPDFSTLSRTVEIRTVIDSDADVALPDDDLLALTAGVEAVVMRRPARRR